MEFDPLAAVATTPGVTAAISAVFLAGLRHGFDIDHVAAITDITSSQLSKRRSLRLATVYAAGHAFVLLALGAIAVLWGQKVPAALDSIFGRIIGATLVVLAGYVLYSLIRFRRDFRIRSRWALVVIGARRALHWLQARPQKPTIIEHTHEHSADPLHAHPEPIVAGTGAVATLTRTHTHRHRHVAHQPSDPFTEYGTATTLGIGMIHGVGAETPTQILLLTTAAGLGGTLGGFVILAAFVLGLFIGNSILALASTFGFASGRRMQLVYMVLAGVTAVVSLYVGVAYALDKPGILPVFLGG